MKMSDAIRIRDLRLLCHVGATSEERDREQVVVVDLDVEIDLSDASRSDDLVDTVDYGSLVSGVADLVSGGSRRLLENLAGEIAGFVLRYEGVEAVNVEVAKADPPVEEEVGSISVRLRRTHDE